MSQHVVTLSSAIRRCSRFHDYSVPIDGTFRDHEIRDVTLYMRHDGIIVNAEGWFHPRGQLVGEVLYAPDTEGDKRLFGQPYRKVTLRPGSYEPVPYGQRGVMLAAYDRTLDQTAINPWFAKYKQMLPLTQFVAMFPCSRALDRTLRRDSPSADTIRRDIVDLERLLEFTRDEVHLGLTGALSLGEIDEYHDLDVVFAGTVRQNWQLAQRIRNLLLRDPRRRCFEGGKSWSLRFFNNRGMLMCCFFTYKYATAAPLSNFRMDIIEKDVRAIGTVADDRHAFYTPTLLLIEQALVSVNRSGCTRTWRERQLHVVVYHTASRGDCVRGDRLCARGALVSIQTPDRTFQAVCVIERDGVVNLTPPWPAYYSYTSTAFG
jgi:predicted nucleotidyltransferase